MAHPAPHLHKEQLVELLLSDFSIACIKRDLEAAGAGMDDLCTNNFTIVLKLMGFNMEEEEGAAFHDLSMGRYMDLENDMLKRYKYRDPQTYSHSNEERVKIEKELGDFVDWLYEELARLSSSSARQ